MVNNQSESVPKVMSEGYNRQSHSSIFFIKAHIYQLGLHNIQLRVYIILLNQIREDLQLP